MKYFITAITILMVFCSSTATSQKPSNPSQNNKSAFSIKRGTNIAHWLSQSNRRGQERAAFFTKKDIDFIKASGFDHIRLPVDEEQLWDSTGKKEDEAFRLLDNCMN